MSSSVYTAHSPCTLKLYNKTNIPQSWLRNPQMKTTLLTIALVMSTSVLANPAVDSLNVAAVKATTSPATIQATLDTWYEGELANIETTASEMTDRMPMVVRIQKATDDLNAEYTKLQKTYGL